MTEQTEIEQAPSSLEAHYQLPRSLCSSANNDDHIWCSKRIFVNNGNSGSIQELCLKSWSPGMVLYSGSGCLNEERLSEMLEVLERTAGGIGKARRITLDFVPSNEMVAGLYRCFYCVEHIDSSGNTIILAPEEERNQKSIDRVQ